MAFNYVSLFSSLSHQKSASPIADGSSRMRFTGTNCHQIDTQKDGDSENELVLIQINRISKLQ